MIYNPIAEFGGGAYRDAVGTRYCEVALRLFVDPNDPKALPRAGASAVRHDPNRLFELALDGLLLALSAQSRRWSAIALARLRSSA